MNRLLMKMGGKYVDCRQVRNGLDLMTGSAGWLLALFIISLIFGADVQAGTVQLPQTGQAKCYRDVSPFDEISCAGTGQDGDKKAGVAWPSSRFVAGTGTEAECITDSLTGLMWVKTPDSFTRSWSSAISYANGLSLCGFTDWRLPNVNELTSLVNAEVPDIAVWLNTQGFSNVSSNYYWSSTTYASDPTNASVLVLYMPSGSVYDILKSFNYYYVLPVRGGQSGAVQLPATGQTAVYLTGDDGDLHQGVAWPSPRFRSNPNGTQTDSLTGLVWLKNADCFGALKWGEALSGVNGLQDGQCDLTDGSAPGDWRLPNRNELRSLIDYSASDPALPPNWFLNVQSDEYWTSTTSGDSTDSSWTVDMFSGNLMSGHKVNTTKAVWPVRDVLVPAAPSKLNATSLDPDSVKLTWVNNAGEGAIFKIYRTADGAAPTLIYTTPAGVTSYADDAAAGNTSSTQYSYTVKACESKVCSPATNKAVVPYKPTLPKVAKLDTGGIRFRWTDNSTNETGFQVSRKVDSGAWTRIGTTKANVTSFDDAEVTSGQTYQYRVRAMHKSAAPVANGYSDLTAPTQPLTY